MSDSFDIDPRSSDFPEDSPIWRAVLLDARREDDALFGVLHGFRCCACRLVKQTKGYKLVSSFGPDCGWQTEEEWAAERQKYLVPHRERLRALLGKERR